MSFLRSRSIQNSAMFVLGVSRGFQLDDEIDDGSGFVTCSEKRGLVLQFVALPARRTRRRVLFLLTPSLGQSVWCAAGGGVACLAPFLRREET